MVLSDVLGFGVAEVAELLDSGEASVKGALQRARATLRARLPAPDRERAPRPNSARERRLVGRFADAVHSGDVDAIAAITWFFDTGVFRHFGLPRTLPNP